MHICNLLDKTFNVMVIKVYAKLGKIMDEQGDLQKKDEKYEKVLNRSYRTE